MVASRAEQKAAVQEMEKAIAGGAKPLAKFYLKMMTRIAEKGLDYAEKEGGGGALCCNSCES